jgi:taurine--2-oxoglutarate transaminase
VEPEQARQVLAETSFVGWRRQAGWSPLLIERAEGCRFFDTQGRSYLDFASQLVATNLGHSNTAVAEAMAAQARRLPYLHPSFSTPLRAELQQELSGVLPHGLSRFFFSTSGTEAVEAALKIARVTTGKPGILARSRSYHGATAGAISVSGEFRRLPVEGLGTVPGTEWAPECYCYRCPLGLRYPNCQVACVEEIDRILARQQDIAAVIVEPIVGSNGVILPVPEYLPRLREITRRRGVLLIADEVMTGWGRTGRWFAVDHYGVVPDILVTAKGITGGYAPLGLTATTEALHQVFEQRYFPHGHTYEAHPVMLAAALAAVREYRRLDLVARSEREGRRLLAELQQLAARHPSVGEVRGLGLFAAVELVRDRASRIPMYSPERKLAGDPSVVEEVAEAMLMRGVFVLAWGSNLILAPPLIVKAEEITEALAALDDALGIADAAAAHAAAPTGALGAQG